jgi:hypothetical protein
MGTPGVCQSLLVGLISNLLISCAPLSGNDTPVILAPERTVDETGVIYDKDSRSEAHYLKDFTIQKLSKLAVALVLTQDLKAVDSATVEVQGGSLQETQGLCSSEKFIEQRTAAFCSGILIDATHVLTAGHCVFTQKECSETSFVFGYEYFLGAPSNYRVSRRNVYSCARVVAAAKSPEGDAFKKQAFDFAIVELSRPVPMPFQVALSIGDSLKKRDEVFTLGYPMGLPKKFASGTVRGNNPRNNYFSALIDTYGGNSGSPVFNVQDGSLEGILISGEDDFVSVPGRDCKVSHKCSRTDCEGEQVLKISKIKKYLSK